MKRLCKRIGALFCAVILACTSVQFAASAAISGKTGIGLAEWALRAYNEKWKYVYGKAEVGKVDCSGLVRSYCNGQGGGATTMLNNYSTVKGNISSIPRVHGLVLYASGSNPPNTAHMGVYVGKNADGTDMVVDARSSDTGIVYNTLKSRTKKPWTQWFKVSLVSYPTTGWYTFNGKKYYYKDGQFVVGKYTVDGVTYDFGKSGALQGKTTGSDTTQKTTTTSQQKTTTKSQSTSLKVGSKGDDVKKLQNRLIELGYLSGSADGTYGSATEAAVKAFQKQCGLTADGIAGQGTQKKLYASDAPKAKKQTTTTTKTTTTTQKKTTAAPTTTTPAATQKSEQPVTTAAEQTASNTDNNSVMQEYERVEAVLRSRNQDPTKFRNLQFSMQGENVKEIQNRLIELGYLDEEATGYYGAFTESAVKDFQSVNGLEVTGEVDMDTYVKMFDGTTVAKPDGFVGTSEEDSPDGADFEENIVVEHNGSNMTVDKEIYSLLSESAFM